MPTPAVVGDAALAVALATAGALSAATAHWWGDAANRPVDGVAMAVVITTGLVLAVRRRWPLATLAVATVLTSGYLVAGYPYGFVLLSFSVAVYTVARHLPLRLALPWSAGALALLLTHLLTSSAALGGLLGLAPGTAWVVVPFAIGVAVRVTRESAAQARAEAVRQRVDDERLRVAQEVHDIVGHGLAAIKMQADVALHVLPKRPEQAQTALDAISRTSSEALDELRATLALVRRPATGDERAPAPTLARIDDLCQRMVEAGMQVHLERAGDPHPLPAIVDLTGYRIVQESLTNVLRHSGARDATVTLRYDADAVLITVSNSLDAVPRPGDGLGIAGMRQRVTDLGGVFSAGPVAGDRFEVRARLPTGGHP